MFKEIFSRKNIKKAIIAVVVIPLAYDFLIKPLAYMFINFSGNIWNTFTNYYYKCVSETNGNEIILLCAYLFCGYMLGKISVFTTKNESIVDKEEKSNSKQGGIFNALLTLILIIMIFFNFSIDKEKNKFDLKIIKITPYVDTSELNMLKSDWTRMRSKDDFNDIMDQIELIVKEHNLD